MKYNIKRILILTVLGIIFATSSISNITFSNDHEIIDNRIEIRDETNLKNPKMSWYNNSENPIYIDGSATCVGAQNWTWARYSQQWCRKGDGTKLDPYVIENVSIDAGNSGSGIYIHNSKNEYFIIKNCTVCNAGFLSTDAGIKLHNTNNGTLINNNCSNNREFGILLYDNCDNNTLSGNIANDNDDYGISLYDKCDNNILTGNTANNNGHSGIFLYNGDENTLLGNNPIENAYHGIYLSYCDINTLSGNTANNNTYYGIYLENCGNNTLSGNTANNHTYYGIYLDNCDNNMFSGNTANNNTYYGILLGNCYNNTLSGNTVNNNTQHGIYLNKCDNSTLSGNTVKNNKQHGIYLDNNCNNNTFTGNIIANNTDIGAYIDDNTCVNNLFYKNSFIGNKFHARDDSTENYNQWDNGIIGNYWDNYSRVDINPEDGIGDTPYNISGSAGSQDNFPIWDDGDDVAPMIKIISPDLLDVFGEDAPSFTIEIIEYYSIDDTWYKVNDITINFTLTEGTTTINQTLWDTLPEDLVTIKLYATDTAGHKRYEPLLIIKSTPQEEEDDKDGESKDNEEIIKSLEEKFNSVLIISTIMAVVIGIMGAALVLVILRNSREIIRLNQAILSEKSKKISTQKHEKR